MLASLFKLQLTLKHGHVCSYIASYITVTVCLRLARPKFVISPGIEAEPPGLSGAWAGRRDLGHNEGGHPDNSDCDTNSFITTSTSIAGGKNLFYSVILSALLPDFGPALQTEQHQVCRARAS